MCVDIKEVLGIEEMKKIIEDIGCKVKMDNNNMSIYIEGNFFQIVKVNQRLVERCEKDRSKMDFMKEIVLIIKIFMFERDYEVVCFFGSKFIWFKGILNKVIYIEDFFCVIDLIVVDNVDIEKNMKQLLIKV